MKDRCALCDKSQEFLITCHVCGKRLCDDCAIYDGNGEPDDEKHICKECLQKRHD